MKGKLTSAGGWKSHSGVLLNISFTNLLLWLLTLLFKKWVIDLVTRLFIIHSFESAFVAKIWGRKRWTTYFSSAILVTWQGQMCMYKERTRTAKIRNGGLEKPLRESPSITSLLARTGPRDLAGPSESARTRLPRWEWARRRTRTTLLPLRLPLPLETRAACGAWGPAGSWAPCYLSDDLWARCGDLAVRVPPAEICLFSLAGRVTSPTETPLRLGLDLSGRHSIFRTLNK